MTANTIDYAKLADDAADTYTSTRDAYNHATANLAVVDNDRDGFQDIVTPDGHIDMPLFNAWFTQDEKNEIAEQAVAYYLAADAYKEYVQGTMQYFKDAMAASTALALVAEVHRLTHQEDAAGALLRDLRDSEDGLTITIRPYSSNIYSFATTDDVYASDDKRALIDQANDQLGAAMSHYDREATELMLTRSFETEADEWADSPLLALAECERPPHRARRRKQQQHARIRVQALHGRYHANEALLRGIARTPQRGHLKRLQEHVQPHQERVTANKRR